jgi:proteasome lid subunit RPN8/RPN11
MSSRKSISKSKRKYNSTIIDSARKSSKEGRELKKNSKKLKIDILKNKEVKQKLYDLISKYHHPFKKLKRYFGEDVSDAIPYKVAEKIFTEEAGAFCKSKKTGKIRYNPNYWKELFRSPDRASCNYETEDMVISFHTHPYGHPHFSSSDLLVSIQYPDVWSCVGAGSSYNKRILCIKPKEVDQFDALMEKLYGGNWNELLKSRKLQSIIPEYENLTLPKLGLLKEGEMFNIFTKVSELNISKSQILRDDIDRKLRIAQKRWILESGLFDLIEYEIKKDVKGNYVITEVELPEDKVRINKEKVEKDINALPFRHEQYDIFFDYTPINKIGFDSTSYDAIGVVTSCDYELETIKTKTGEPTQYQILHAYLTINDGTGEIDLEYHNSLFGLEEKVATMIQNKELVGSLIRVGNAEVVHESGLSVTEGKKGQNIIYEPPIEKKWYEYI